MRQYLDVLDKILKVGVEKQSGRANMPNTIGISKADISMDLNKGFPLLTTKKMYWKGIVHELLWFLHGDTNIKYLVDNDVHIWDQDAYRWYCKHGKDNNSEVNSILRSNTDGSYSMFTFEEFIEKIKLAKDHRYLPRYGDYMFGELGKVYGYQWRRKQKVWNDEQGPEYDNIIIIIDQVKDLINGLKNNPYSRYHIINAWDKGDFDDMALPPCHLLYQFIVRPITQEQRLNIAIFKYECIDCDWKTGNIDQKLEEYKIPKFTLDLNMYQRSCDTFLGVPFNIASMSLLLMIVAKASNMLVGIANWIGGDTHIYVDHIDVCKEQLTREPMPLPEMIINKELNSLDDILTLTIDDFELIHYNSHGKLKGELFTGMEKVEKKVGNLKSKPGHFKSKNLGI